MSGESSNTLPLWAQDREVVLAQENNDIQWRDGKPDYSETNQYQIKERITNHAEGSLNAIMRSMALRDRT